MISVQSVPPLLAAPPFQYVFEADAAEVVVDVDFAIPVHDEALRNRFIYFWEAWLYVSAAGGFETEDFSRRVIKIFPSGEPDSNPDQISMFMEDVSVNERAFDVLVNGFHRLHFVCCECEMCTSTENFFSSPR